MGRILFITGTGTDIGKTALSLAVVLWARGRGLRAAYHKPVQCGTFAFGEPPVQGGDADWLARMAGGAPTAHVTYALRMAASPHLAAESEGVPLSPAVIRDDMRSLARSHDLVVCEGAGGAAVPLDRQGATLASLAAEAGAPALIAAAPGLGTLHHTLATVAYLRSVNAPLAGFAFCSRESEVSDLAADNAVTLASLSRLPYFGLLPFHAALAAGRPLGGEAAAWLAPLAPGLDAWWAGA